MELNGIEIKYTLFRNKPVSSIRMKVSKKSGICISIPPEVTVEQVEDFIRAHGDAVIRSLEKYNLIGVNMAPVRSKEQLQQLVNKYVYKYYNIMKSTDEMPAFPRIRFRLLKTRWGACNVEKNDLSFNVRLASKPKEAIEYVVVHELSHFIVQGHSKAFYDTIERFMPDWKIKRKTLQNDWNPDISDGE